MRVIYADSMILINFAIDYLLLLATARICSLPLRRRRMALGALFGGVFALCCALDPALDRALFKLMGGLITAAIAHWGSGPFLRTAAVFLSCAAAFGGAVYAAVSLGGGRVSALPPKALLLSFALCYALLSLVFKGRARLSRREICKAEISFLGRSVSFQALRDTGNELTDSSGCPVMTAELTAIAPLLPALPQLYNWDGPEMLLSLSALPGLEGRCRLFPCLTAAGPGGLLPAFRPDSIVIAGEKTAHSYIAIVPGPLSRDGSYQAIF